MSILFFPKLNSKWVEKSGSWHSGYEQSCEKLVHQVDRTSFRELARAGRRGERSIDSSDNCSEQRCLCYWNDHTHLRGDFVASGL